MKIIVIFATALAVLGACTLSVRGAMAQASPSSTHGKIESPFYCNRKAIPPEQRERKEELNQRLRSLHRNSHELANGYEFELPGDPSTVQAAAEWAALEKLCCPFFDIDLVLQREDGPFLLRLTGREGVKQFILSEFSPWFRAAM
jgi:hypothetical protein